VYFVDEEDCWMLTSDGRAVTCTLASDLCSDHKEADTRTILHCIHASSTSMSEQTTPIVVRSPDTDVLILLLSYVSSVTQPLYLDTGFSNKCRMVDVKVIAKVLGPDLCAVLPTYHEFTGCDYTSAFLRKGKVKPFQILQRHPHIISSNKHLFQHLCDLIPNLEPTCNHLFLMNYSDTVDIMAIFHILLYVKLFRFITP